VFNSKRLHSKVMNDRIMDNNIRKFVPKGDDLPTLKRSHSCEHLTAGEKETKRQKTEKKARTKHEVKDKALEKADKGAFNIEVIKDQDADKENDVKNSNVEVVSPLKEHGSREIEPA